MTTEIKFGTDGWRAIIAQEYTVENVKRVSAATAMWLREKGEDKVVIGHDCRFAGELFAETAARVMGSFGIKVNLAKGFVSTPMVSLGVVKTRSYLGIVITASHNPPSYNGYKLKSYFGGATVPSEIAQVEAMIPDTFDAPLPTLETMAEKGLLNYIDLETMYVQEVEQKFDLDAIRNAGFKIGYDAMYGAGQRVMKRILPDVVALHCDDNPGFHGQAPEPIHRNLLEFSELIKSRPDITVGLANDGDADRIGMYDDEGNFVDSHHLLLLLVHYLHKYKGLNGKVIITFSVTDKVKKLCETYNLPYLVTKIGFKYITELFVQGEDILVGGEESGGIAAKGHIPERDGIWMGLLIFEFMAKTGKTIRELIQEIYDIVGSFAFDRDDLHLTNELKNQIIDNCKSGAYKSFGAYSIQKTEDIDGFKFVFNDDEWVMIRPSGTEPVLRVYAQSATLAGARKILDATKLALLG